MDEERTEPGMTPYEVRVRPGRYVLELGGNALLFLFCVLLVLAGALGQDSGVLVDILMRLFGLSLGSAILVAFRNLQQLLRDSRPALRITEEGILNRTVRSWTPFLPWEEILDIRKSRRSRMLFLRNPEAFWKRQPWPDRVLKGIGKLLATGDWVPLYLPQLDAPREEVTRRILEIVEEREIEGIRKAKQIGDPERGTPEPASDSEASAPTQGERP